MNKKIISQKSLEKIAYVQYNKIAEEFQNADQAFSDVTRPILYSYVDTIDLKGKNVLDLGCGYGQDLVSLASKGARVFGVDISDSMINIAKDKCPSAVLTTALMENLPYENNKFNFVFSRYAIQHSVNVERILEEVNRVLESNGELLFLVTDPIRQFLEKKTKNYWQQEIVKSSILGGKVEVEEPSHTFMEYINSTTLKNNFKLLDFNEAEDPAAQKISGYESYPGVSIFHYRKVSELSK